MVLVVGLDVLKHTAAYSMLHHTQTHTAKGKSRDFLMKRKLAFQLVAAQLGQLMEHVMHFYIPFWVQTS